MTGPGGHRTKTFSGRNPQAHPQACLGCRQQKVPHCISPHCIPVALLLCLIPIPQGRHLQSTRLAQVNCTGPVHCPRLWGRAWQTQQTEDDLCCPFPAEFGNQHKPLQSLL